MGRRTDLPEFRSRQIKNQRRLPEHTEGMGRFFRQSLRRSFPGFPLARKYGFRIGIFRNSPARRRLRFRNSFKRPDAPRPFLCASLYAASVSVSAPRRWLGYAGEPPVV